MTGTDFSSNRDKINILIIEDNPGDANLVRIYLRNAGLKYDFYHSETFYGGLDMIEELQIQLVLLDLSLPDSQGFKTLTTFVSKHPNLPVIVLTGLNDEIIGNQSVKAGAQDFLVKGQFDSNLLGRVIRYSLQRHKTQIKLEQYARKLSISERRFIEAQEMAHFGNWEMDIVTNTMKWTDEVYRIFGLEPQSFSPTLSDYLGAVHHEDRTRTEETFLDVAKDGQLRKIDYRIVVDGRRIKHLSNQIKVYFDEQDERVTLVGAVQDITEIKVSQELLIEKNLSDRTSKIKEEILSDLAFHIRTPLSSLVNLSYLLERTESPEQQTEYIEGLKTSVNDLSVAVNNLLNFSILLSDKVQLEDSTFHIEELLQRIQQVFQIKADNKNIHLQLRVFDSVPKTLIGDMNKISQVIYNLLDNAINFTEENGTVSLKIICNDPKSQDLKIFLIVEDNGVGMDEKLIRKLSNASQLLSFKQNQEQKEGLGFAIITKLTEKMNGQISIESKVGKGSKFTIELPIRVPQVVERTGLERPVAPLRILLVEDHFLNQIATKKVLTTWSDFVKVDIAENGLVGYEKFREYQYDLILMDLQMPVMNGFEATEKIREHNKNIPIIALTANSSNQEAEKTHAIGMNEYLAKPFKPQDLYDKIMDVLF